MLACVKYLENFIFDSNQETVLAEQFGKLTKNQQKKVNNVRVTIFAIIVTNIIVTKVMDLHFEGEGSPLVAVFRTNCIQGSDLRSLI